MNGLRGRGTAALLAVAALGWASPGAAFSVCVPVPVVDDRCEAWSAMYNHAQGWRDQARGLAVGGNRVFVTGLTEAPSGYPAYDYATVAYDLGTGAQLWARSYDGPLQHVDIAWAAAAAPDGARVYVTGESVGPPGNGSDFATVAYDGATGQELWIARHNLRTTDAARAIELSPDSRTVYVAGRGLVEGANEGIVLIAYDAQTGAELWSGRHVANGYVGVNGLAVDPQGRRVYVAGSPSGGGPYDQNFLAVAFRARVDDLETEKLGDLLWTATYDGGLGGSRDTVSSIALSPDGSKLFLVGSAERNDGFIIVAFDMATAAFDAATGQRLWAQRYPGGSSGSGSGSDVVVSPNGQLVFAVGHSSGQAGNRFATVAYDAATGNQAWTAPYDFPGYAESGLGVGVAPNGQRVYVTGASSPIGFQAAIDVATVAYEAANGNPAWTARFNSSAALVDENRPWTMAVAPNGRVLVTGGFRRYTESAPLGAYDYGVLAYDA